MVKDALHRDNGWLQCTFNYIADDANDGFPASIPHAIDLISQSIYLNTLSALNDIGH